MGVKNLRILFCFCNVAGLLPFRMVTNGETNGFKRFDRHWRHPANWWFLILFFVHVAYIIRTSYEQIYQFISENKLATIYKVVYTLSIFNYTLLVTVPRFFLVNFKHLETALEILNDIDRLTMVTPIHFPCKTMQRTIIGIFASLFWVNVEQWNFKLIKHGSKMFVF
jgi:hypothetical protein